MNDILQRTLFTRSRLSATTIAAVFATLLSSASSARAERLVVPLSDPTKPAAIEVSLVAGSISVVGSTTREVVIDATSEEAIVRPSHRDRPDRQGMKRIPNTGLGLEAEEKGNKVSISANSWSRPVEIRIEVPAGSSLELSTVNGGDIEVENVSGEIVLNNTNGEIHAREVRGPVSASTVNGDISIVFTNEMSAAPMAFSTLNGDVDVTLPAALKADVRLRSDNGEIYSDFDIALGAKPDMEEVRGKDLRYRIVVANETKGKIAGGGTELFLKTFNGDVLLRRKK